MPPKKLMELKNVDFFYTQGGRKVQVLKKINLTIHQGELVAIKGPSGSGKSTLLALMGLLLSPSEGEIFIHGRPVHMLSDTEMSTLRNKTMGFVFQQFHLLPRMDVLSNILLPTYYPWEEKKGKDELKKSHLKAQALSEFLGINHRLRHLPQQLSGGQQQRVAIARALIHDPDLILMDEPTGNLDSESSRQILQKIKELNKEGKTIVIITHDQEVANQCSLLYEIKDGEINQSAVASGSISHDEVKFSRSLQSIMPIKETSVSLLIKLVSLVGQNIFRHKIRSFLTMIGITIGVAAVLTMMTLGSYTKEKILSSYAELGVNTMMFHGYPNWRMKATDYVPVMFRFFDWEKDLIPLKNIFPQLRHLSPYLISWSQHKAMFAGKVYDQDVQIVGINHVGLSISNRQLLLGRNFSLYHMTNRTPVCLIGLEVYRRLFHQGAALGKIIQLSNEQNVYSCQVIGVLKSQSSKNSWIKPDSQIFLPYTFFQSVNDWWNSQIKEVLFQVKDGSDIEKTGQAIEYFFNQKYGASGIFKVSSDSMLIGQMKKFLNLFAVILGAISFISLVVGGIGITNMMLVSVSERLREIGLRKAVGATAKSIRYQFLGESIVLCLMAGLFGLLLGFLIYQSIIYGATIVSKDIQFEWVLNPLAFITSFLSIILVGVLSGLIPALKAEKLQVMEALRSE